eukprot:CFRG0908T1
MNMKRDEVGIFRDPTLVTPEKPMTWDTNAESFGCYMNGPLNALSQSPSGNQLVVAGRDVLQIINLSDAECHPSQNLRVMRKHLNYSSYDVHWHPHPSCGNWIATAASNGAIVLWDLNMHDVKKTARIIKEHDRSVHRIRFNALEHHLLLSGSQDGTMKMWDLRTKSNHILSFNGRAESVRDIGFNPHNSTSFAAAFENGSVQVWDIRMPTTWETRIAAHQGPTFCINWHPEDKSVLASGGRDRVIKIWRVGGIALRSSTGSSHPGVGATLNGNELLASVQTIASVCRVAWRPRHRYHIASCALVTDNSIHVWDLRRPYIPTASFMQNKDLVTGMEWHVNDEGNSLVSVSKGRLAMVHHYAKAERPSRHVPSTSMSWTSDDSICVVHGSVGLPSGDLPDITVNSTPDAYVSHGYFNRNSMSSNARQQRENEQKMTAIANPIPYPVNPRMDVHIFNNQSSEPIIDADSTPPAHLHSQGQANAERTVYTRKEDEREEYTKSMDPITYMAKNYLLTPPVTPLLTLTPSSTPDTSNPGSHTLTNDSPVSEHVDASEAHSNYLRRSQPQTDDTTDTRTSSPSTTIRTVSDLCRYNAHVALACGSLATANTWQILSLMLKSLGYPNKMHTHSTPTGDMESQEAGKEREKLLYFEDRPIGSSPTPANVDRGVDSIDSSSYHDGTVGILAKASTTVNGNNNTQTHSSARDVDISNLPPPGTTNDSHGYTNAYTKAMPNIPPKSSDYFGSGNSLVIHGMYKSHSSSGQTRDGGMATLSTHQNANSATPLIDLRPSKDSTGEFNLTNSKPDSAARGSTFKELQEGNTPDEENENSSDIDSDSGSDSDNGAGDDLDLADDIFDLLSPLASVSLSSQESILMGYGSWTVPIGGTSNASPSTNFTDQIDGENKDITLTPQLIDNPRSPWATPAVVADVLLFSADQGDVQFCCTLLQVLGSHVESLPQTFTSQMYEEWFMAYIDILHRRRQFSIANTLIKQSIVPAINELNQDSTTIYIACSTCLKPLLKSGSGCQRCRNRSNSLCGLCRQVVSGPYAWCQGCGHGGHLHHMQQWFSNNDMCPTGCNHRCQQ